MKPIPIARTVSSPSRSLSRLARGCAAVAVLAASLSFGCKGEGSYSEATVDKIKGGMSPKEVEAILGGPGEEVHEPLQPQMVNDVLVSDQAALAKITKVVRWTEGRNSIKVV